MTPAEAAAAARTRRGIGNDAPIPDLLKVIEDSGIPVFIIPLDGIDGAFQIPDEQPYIAVNSALAPVRQRFTLAHELGHFELGHDAQVDIKIDHGSSVREEVEANEFAAAFLMPRAAVDTWIAGRGEIDGLEPLVRMSSAFGMSAEAACYRLDNLNRLPAGAKRDLLRGIRDGLHLEIARENSLGTSDSIEAENRYFAHMPFGMQTVVADLVGRELIDANAAAGLLRIDPDEAKLKIEKHLEVPKAEDV